MKSTSHPAMRKAYPNFGMKNERITRSARQQTAQ
jgi:hypothetical protein